MDTWVRPFDMRLDRAWGALESLLRTYPEGIPGIVALDRLVAYGMAETDAVAFLRELESQGLVAMSGGRWVLP